jgi:hypothetical protein
MGARAITREELESRNNARKTKEVDGGGQRRRAARTRAGDGWRWLVDASSIRQSDNPSDSSVKREYVV